MKEIASSECVCGRATEFVFILFNFVGKKRKCGERRKTVWQPLSYPNTQSATKVTLWSILLIQADEFDLMYPVKSLYCLLPVIYSK